MKGRLSGLPFFSLHAAGSSKAGMIHSSPTLAPSAPEPITWGMSPRAHAAILPLGEAPAEVIPLAVPPLKAALARKHILNSAPDVLKTFLPIFPEFMHEILEIFPAVLPSVTHIIKRVRQIAAGTAVVLVPVRVMIIVIIVITPGIAVCSIVRVCKWIVPGIVGLIVE
jgi:hypothetical protein